MKLSKLVGVVALMFCLQTVFGQNKSELSVEQTAQIVTKKISDYVQLRDDQVDRIRDINMSVAMNNHEARMDSNLSLEKKMHIVNENNANRKKYYKEVLSPEQFKKYLEFEEAMKVKKSKQQPAKAPTDTKNIEQPNPEFGEL
jgi:hypothetical protein